MNRVVSLKFRFTSWTAEGAALAFAVRWSLMSLSLRSDDAGVRHRIAFNAICLPLGLIALVFLPVGRLDWKPGWIFIAFLVAAFGASALILARVNPSIYRARSRFQPDLARWTFAN